MATEYLPVTLLIHILVDDFLLVRAQLDHDAAELVVLIVILVAYYAKAQQACTLQEVVMWRSWLSPELQEGLLLFSQRLKLVLSNLFKE